MTEGNQETTIDTTGWPVVRLADALVQYEIRQELDNGTTLAEIQEVIAEELALKLAEEAQADRVYD